MGKTTKFYDASTNTMKTAKVGKSNVNAHSTEEITTTGLIGAENLENLIPKNGDNLTETISKIVARITNEEASGDTTSSEIGDFKAESLVVTDNYTLTDEDHGKLIICKNLTQNITITLPQTKGVGWVFTFVNRGPDYKVTILDASKSIIRYNRANQAVESFDVKINNKVALASDGENWYEINSTNTIYSDTAGKADNDQNGDNIVKTYLKQEDAKNTYVAKDSMDYIKSIDQNEDTHEITVGYSDSSNKVIDTISKADSLSTPVTINNVEFNGVSDITITDMPNGLTVTGDAEITDGKVIASNTVSVEIHGNDNSIKFIGDDSGELGSISASSYTGTANSAIKDNADNVISETYFNKVTGDTVSGTATFNGDIVSNAASTFNGKVTVNNTTETYALDVNSSIKAKQDITVKSDSSDTKIVISPDFISFEGEDGSKTTINKLYYSGLAEKANSDSAGNDITTTYATKEELNAVNSELSDTKVSKSGDSMTGSLVMTGEGTNITFKDSDDDESAGFINKQKYSGTADKAEKDVDGKEITATYLNKADDVEQDIAGSVVFNNTITANAESTFGANVNINAKATANELEVTGDTTLNGVATATINSTGDISSKTSINAESETDKVSVSPDKITFTHTEAVEDGEPTVTEGSITKDLYTGTSATAQKAVNADGVVDDGFITETYLNRIKGGEISGDITISGASNVTNSVTIADTATMESKTQNLHMVKADVDTLTSTGADGSTTTISGDSIVFHTTNPDKSVKINSEKYEGTSNAAVYASTADGVVDSKSIPETYATKDEVNASEGDLNAHVVHKGGDYMEGDLEMRGVKINFTDEEGDPNPGTITKTNYSGTSNAAIHASTDGGVIDSQDIPTTYFNKVNGDTTSSITVSGDTILNGAVTTAEGQEVALNGNTTIKNITITDSAKSSANVTVGDDSAGTKVEINTDGSIAFTSGATGSINAETYTGTANKAVADKDGNEIDTTYLKNAGGEVTGNLTVDGKLTVNSEDGVEVSSGTVNAKKVVAGEEGIESSGAVKANGGIETSNIAVTDGDVVVNLTTGGTITLSHSTNSIIIKDGDKTLTLNADGFDGLAAKATADSEGSIIKDTYLNKITGGTVEKDLRIGTEESAANLDVSGDITGKAITSSSISTGSISVTSEEANNTISGATTFSGNVDVHDLKVSGDEDDSSISISDKQISFNDDGSQNITGTNYTGNANSATYGSSAEGTVDGKDIPTTYLNKDTEEEQIVNSSKVTFKNDIEVSGSMGVDDINSPSLTIGNSAEDETDPNNGTLAVNGSSAFNGTVNISGDSTIAGHVEVVASGNSVDITSDSINAESILTVKNDSKQNKIVVDPTNSNITFTNNGEETGKIDGANYTGLAAKATADSAGNDIISTYYPISGGKIKGEVEIGDTADGSGHNLLVHGQIQGSSINITSNEANTINGPLTVNGMLTANGALDVKGNVSFDRADIDYLTINNSINLGEGVGLTASANVLVKSTGGGNITISDNSTRDIIFNSVSGEEGRINANNYTGRANKAVYAASDSLGVDAQPIQVTYLNKTSEDDQTIAGKVIIDNDLDANSATFESIDSVGNINVNDGSTITARGAVIANDGGSITTGVLTVTDHINISNFAIDGDITSNSGDISVYDEHAFKAVNQSTKESISVSSSVVVDDSDTPQRAVVFYNKDNMVESSITAKQYTGNSATATALANSVTIGGHAFNGTQNVELASTDLTDNDNIVHVNDEGLILSCGSALEYDG